MIAEQREVLDAFAPRLQHGQCGARHRGLEAECEEHHLARRIDACQLQRIEWRIDHSDIRPIGLRVQQAALRTGHAHGVAKGREDDLWIAGEGYAVIHAPHRQDADRAAGAMHELDRVLRQHRLQAVAEDGVGVAAADFHHLQGPTACGGQRRSQTRDFADQGAGLAGVPEFIGVAHAYCSFIAETAAEPRSSASKVCVRSHRM